MMADLSTIIDAVVDASGVPRTEVIGRRQQAKTVRARQLVCWLAKEYTPMSFPEIGRSFGDRDHTTIIHGCNQWDVYRRFEPYNEWERVAVVQLEQGEVVG